jgi:hypothetical protein
VTRILNPDSTFNEEAYQKYSPLYLSTTFAVSYGLSFASITATLTHAFLYFRNQIWKQARRAMHEQPDIHARLMARYRQVPEWWYSCVFRTLHLFAREEWRLKFFAVIMFAFGIISIEVWDTKVISFILEVSSKSNSLVGCSSLCESKSDHPPSLLLKHCSQYLVLALVIGKRSRLWKFRC